MMKNLSEYNKFVQTLELKAQGGLFFHRINEQIYITDYTHKLLGIWELDPGHPIPFKEALNNKSDQITGASN
ncbi:MAG: hypothetical protein JSR17_11545 [Proteobacteria bacterium]|nr:hypothetical protein [Pseudomonadota bacterium]